MNELRSLRNENQELIKLLEKPEASDQEKKKTQLNKHRQREFVHFRMRSKA